MAATGVEAQLASGPARPGQAHTIIGVVLDSVRRRPLAGAEVVIAGTATNAVTDSLGRFSFDSLPAGQYRIAFFHPLLDSMSVAAAPATLSVPLAPGRGVMLAIPSSRTLARAICAIDNVANMSLLLGRVTDPDTGEPVAGASVFVEWTDFEATKKKGLERTPRAVQGGTDATGAYRVCGLPKEVEAIVYASRDSSATSRIAISSTTSGIVIRDLTLEAPGSTRAKRASIMGTVRTADNAPVSGATVTVPGVSRRAITDTSGAFALDGLPLGTQNVTVRRLGFSPTVVALDLTSRGVHKVDAVLHEYSVVLDPLYVIAQRDRALARVGFTSRRSQGLGAFATRKDFERSNPTFLSDIVGKMRGIRVHYVNGRRLMLGAGEGSECLRLVVDAIPQESGIPGDLDDIVLPEHIAAIEVYSGAAVPLLFENGFSRGCVTIVVWTRTRVKDL